MPNDRFFTPDTLTAEALILLPEEESRHLTRVMRVQVGEPVEIINGKGQLAQATLVAIKKHNAQLRVDNVVAESKPSLELILAQAIPRLTRLDTIVEKATELGITQLWLFPGQRSEKKELSKNQQERVHALTVAALKQSGRLFLPEVILKPPLKSWEGLPYPAFFGDIDGQAPAFEQEKPKVVADSIIFFIGPEAGFAPEETMKLKQLSAKGVRLHPNILRTDTAPLVALSLISHWRYCKTTPL